MLTEFKRDVKSVTTDVVVRYKILSMKRRAVLINEEMFTLLSPRHPTSPLKGKLRKCMDALSRNCSAKTHLNANFYS